MILSRWYFVADLALVAFASPDLIGSQRRVLFRQDLAMCPTEDASCRRITPCRLAWRLEPRKLQHEMEAGGAQPELFMEGSLGTPPWMGVRRLQTLN